MSVSRNGYIGRAPGDSSITIARKTYEPTGVQTDFTFDAGYDPGYCDVYLNGSRLISGNDYAAVNGSTVGLTSAAQNGDILEIVAYKAFNLGVPLKDITGNLDVTGNISASSSITANSGTGEIYGAFVGDGSGLTGVASTDYIITGTAATFNSQVKVFNLNVTGVSTVATTLHVGTALTAYAAGDVETVGIITAASFSGSGANLTGVASTDNIITGTAATFRNTAVNAGVPNVNIVGLATVGILTAYGTLSGTAADFSAESTFDDVVNVGGIINANATTESTSTSTGALVVDGGVGIAKSLRVGTELHVGSNVTIGGTLTYEDVTNIDSVGLVTARAGVNVSGGQLTVGSGVTIGYAGVATFSGTSDVHLTDNVKLLLGDAGASDVEIYHDSVDTYINNSTGTLYLRGDTLSLNAKSTTDKYFDATNGGASNLYYDNSKKWETTNDGTVVTGIATATVGIDAAISVWTLGADGTNHYTFTGPGNLSGTNDPTLNLIRGQKYTFKNRSGGHPFRIQSTANGSTGTQYNTGVTNNDGGDGTNIIFDVPHDAPSILYYQCTSHGNMGGAMYISGSAYETKIGSNITLGTAGVVTATSFSGDGSALTGISAGGISTSVSTAAGIVSTLALSDAQDHKVTVSGITTFTCNGGTEGDTHTLRIINSGITTIGFSTYFLFPSGSAPSIPTADGTVSLISFTVHRQGGSAGITTQLLAGASLNFS